VSFTLVHTGKYKTEDKLTDLKHSKTTILV